ncbi:MAG: N-6 DNA methylase [Phenylobacterium sp.]|uniref:type ISP restriction/modification enzyme n=1 Tax=Phenylobacterium sp. TaxID=1871053 RepID=UPI0025F001A4|nr:type ISP restriction/modification enzyme [Phenylobacterium sp.]MCG9915581.1 N-6 DNA methylase [Phenylobacterium sp.]
MPADFDAFLRALASTPIDGKTEHSDRGALEILLQASADDAEPGAHVQHEPRRDKSGGGSPDFKVTRQGRIAGYVEVKAIDENLSKVLKSDQIKKYRKLSDNIVLTDYLEFCWIRPDGEVLRHRLAYSEDLSAKSLRPKAESVEAVRMLLRGFFSATPGKITKSQDLALALASRASMLRDFLTTELDRQESQHTEGRLFALYEAFKVQVFHDLAVPDFTDAFGQMLAYGLFLARLNAGEHQTVTLLNVRQFIPGSFALIRELVRFLEEMNEEEYRDIRWVVDEILSIVNGIDLASIHGDLSFRSRKAISRKVRAGDEEEHRLFERDPFIYFYEDFLKAYDPAMRKSRGVYYTPPPVVNFIVRAIDDILKDKFNIRDGLADHRRVTVLDFATGTGTFLLEVMERIFDNIGGPDAGRADQIVREHVTKNLYGFEYLIAPYTIAHLKLSQYLKDKGHPLQDQERLQVFLTNTLEPVEPQRNLLMPALSAEVEAAQRVKDQPILVITGNPPYSGHSKNKGAWITAQIDAYKFTIETDEEGREFRKPLGERNPKWLNDDYVKFIRFAQDKMDRVEEGIVGVITNHSWLDNPTFRGMRQSLMRTFDQIYVLDLHGNTKKKEVAPDGSKDENVFDIEQGVAISLFVKKSGLERGVWRGDLWGKRLEKYRATAEGDLDRLGFERIEPAQGFYLFTKQDAEARARYNTGHSLTDIFPVNVLGFQTHRDAFAISFTKSEMEQKLKALADIQNSNEDLFKRYGIKSNRDWDLDESRASVRRSMPSITNIAYRPFDNRWSEFGHVTMDYPRRELLDHVAGVENLTLLVPRQIGTPVWQHIFIADRPAESCMISSDTKSQNQVLPVWLSGRRENISVEFRQYLDSRYGHHFGPEEIVGYIYAILHARTYRRRFAEFLRIDFPRIPFVDTRTQFDALSDLGWDLIQAHLLREVPATKPRLGVYHGKGDHTVEAVRYSPDEQAIWINKAQYFGPIPQEVWDFRIGGYQVLDKYLKSRKGRILSLDEQTHIGDVAESLAFTVSQMARIDEAYCEAFPEHAGDPKANGG